MAASSFTTPMMRQYLGIKKQYEDCLLFYRMGDFYELFLDDALVGSQILNITLTSRSKGKDGRIPMAGVPYHAVDVYLSKLVKAGYKVAICEQMSLPNKRGIIDREVIRIVTPGTMLDEKSLDKKEHNYIMAIAMDDKKIAFSVADLSTGYFSSCERAYDNVEEVLKREIARLSPSECILPIGLYNNPQFLKLLRSQKKVSVYPFSAWELYEDDAQKVLKDHFGVATLKSFGLHDKKIATTTAAVLLGYLQTTQKATVAHIKHIEVYEKEDFMTLDPATIINLELFSTIREHDTRASLLHILDETITAMGGRLLKTWLRQPLIDKKSIGERFDAVEAVINNFTAQQKMRELLKEIPDIERIVARLSVGLGNARDLQNIKQALRITLEIKEIVKNIDSSLIQTVFKKISSDLNKTIEFIDRHIVAEPPVSIKEGGMIQYGIHKELDTLKDRVVNSKDWIAKMEIIEREKTGIGSLKIRFNKVFGFYIEISKSNLHLVPKSYDRKQTLVNGERFITPPLKEHEEIILSAEEKINEFEYIIFQKVLTHLMDHISYLQQAAQSIAMIDCLLNFSHIAQHRNYVRPTLSTSGDTFITAGRHPVVEKLLDDKQFVPNDVSLNEFEQLLLITGPNMAGKSVFIRQVALIVLMAQIGCFVPAEKADISVVDRIFVRSGASDVITSGLSTFMVEMVEAAHILRYATEKSLIILDEIGRGTSTYDGISIAWAIVEYLVKQKHNPKTLFATHYHELQALEKQYPDKIKNYHMAVENQKDEPIFLHTILPGGASHSFGVAVAKLAGIPEEVIIKANELLHTLEGREEEVEKPKKALSIDQTQIIDHIIHKELEDVDIVQMTPLEALNKLADLKAKMKLLKPQKRQQFIEAD